MAKKIVELKSKRKVAIADMSIDDVDYCNDLTVLRQGEDGKAYVQGMSKARTAWLRKGIVGGDFKPKFKEDPLTGAADDSILKQLTEELRGQLNFKKQKEPTWNINNPLKAPAKVAKNVGMFGGALGIALINGLINDVLAPNLFPRKLDKSTGEYIDNPRDFDIRRIFFPNKFKK